MSHPKLRRSPLAALTVLIGLLALLGLSSLALGAGGGSNKRASHDYTAVAKTATIKASGGFPAVGGTSTAAGTITIEQNGRTIHGMAKNNITVTEQVDPTTFAFEGTGRLFAPHWSTKQTFTGEFELQPDGSVQVTVEGDTISGTENRKGVTGVFQGTGSSPAVEPGAILTMNTEGTDKY